MPEPNKRVLSGMRSTNPRLHIGNYEGALKPWVALQGEGYEMFCMVADLHGLTTHYENPAEIARNSREVAKDYVAAGIDPAKSAIFIQSHLPEHSELHLLLSMITPLGWLERVPTYKEKLQDLEKSKSTEQVYFRQVATMIAFAAGIGHHLLNSADDTNEQYTHVTVDTRILLRLIEALTYSRDLLTDARPKQAAAVQSLLDEEITFLSKIENWSATVTSEGTFALNELPFEPRELVEGLKESADRIFQLSGSTFREPYGLLGYPVLQTADILLYKPYGVPVGRDQAPHLEIGNDIGHRFNSLYKVHVFEPYKYLIPADESRAKVPGTDMRKMSKSYDNCLYLNDTEDETAARIKGAFTTPTKIKMTDPGIPEGCAVCQYLKLYSPNWQTQWDEDVQGLRGCSQNKRELTEVLNEYLKPFRERRKQLDDATIEDILRDGANRARERAAQTLAEVKSAMGLR